MRPQVGAQPHHLPAFARAHAPPCMQACVCVCLTLHCLAQTLCCLIRTLRFGASVGSYLIMLVSIIDNT